MRYSISATYYWINLETINSNEKRHFLYRNISNFELFTNLIIAQFFGSRQWCPGRPRHLGCFADYFCLAFYMSGLSMSDYETYHNWANQVGFRPFPKMTKSSYTFLFTFKNPKWAFLFTNSWSWYDKTLEVFLWILKNFGK